MSGELLVLMSLGSIVALWGAQRLRTWWANQHQKEQIDQAWVLEKALVQEHGSGWDPDQRHVVTFSLPDGSRRHFVVSEVQYQRIHAGQEGQLHTRGSWFHSFEINVTVLAPLK
jgi:Protein of unknown function (DUF2500)